VRCHLPLFDRTLCMSDSAAAKPNAVTAWMYRMVPKLPKRMRPKNMMVLHHVGRRSGQPRTTGLQQIYHDSDKGTYFVAAAYGPKSDWWRNVVADPHVSIEVGGTSVEAVAEPVNSQEAVTVMEAAIEEKPRLRDQAFKHAGVDVMDPDGTAKVIAVNPLMSFQVSTSDHS
jgi:deazaflavin-dependent oxidoreductase (nitroreductase family)